MFKKQQLKYIIPGTLVLGAGLYLARKRYLSSQKTQEKSNQEEMIQVNQQPELLQELWPNNIDFSSQSNINSFTTKHYDINLEIDLELRKITGQVDLVMKVLNPTQEILLDSKYLNILSVSVSDIPTEFQIIQNPEHKENLGDILQINLSQKLVESQLFVVQIKFESQPDGQSGPTGLSWLEPSQTFGERFPFLLTQCEPIYCRTIFPCQDSPSIKSTFQATATIKKPFSVYISGELYSTQDLGDSRKFVFKQNIPIPSYLFAIVAGIYLCQDQIFQGNLESRQINQRNFVISEPEILDRCANEFSEMEKYLSAIEKYIFEYRWNTYSVVVLPKSFPFGGMENPNLTFVSPSIVVGDKSSTDVVIHEMVHSWAGNLMSCANWESFWLNEGFTVFFERETQRALVGEEIYQLECVNGNRALQKTIEAFGVNHSYTSLSPDLKHDNPDDAFSSVPYEKGFQYLRQESIDENFQRFLQEKIGINKFQDFMRQTIQYFAEKSVTANEFRQRLIDFTQANDIQIDIEWDQWVLSPGYPPHPLPFENQIVAKYQQFVDLLIQNQVEFFSSKQIEKIQQLSAKEKIFFLDQLTLSQDKLSQGLIQGLDQALGILNTWKNPELLMRFFVLAINLNYELALGNELLNFLQSTGRMKFIKPIYQALAKKYREKGTLYFKQCQSGYHSIANEQIKKMFL